MIAQALAAALALATTQAPRVEAPRLTTASGRTVSNLPFPTGNVQTLNIIEWDSNQLPRFYERSDQLPLTDEEIAKLSKAGFESIDYVELRDAETLQPMTSLGRTARLLAAARMGTTRLIDNLHVAASGDASVQ